jgi:beta-galactosidase
VRPRGSRGRGRHFGRAPSPTLLYGGDYNPEQWPEETWLEDVELMQEANVNMVTLGVFSWALLEPDPGRYDFDWLDRVIDLLWAHGVAVDLATPTAAPPAWLVRLHPEVLPVTAEGVRLEFGSRRHCCPSSPAFRDATVRLVEQLAARYHEHPALAMWHVSNEYGCHLPACYCSVSADHFRRWLRQRYGEIESLNRAWGTAFWGQRYRDFLEIEPPRRTPASVNPSQALDWARFSSDALLECFEAERAVLERITPDVPVTTNFMSLSKPVDAWTWSRGEDVVTLDSYPDPADSEASVTAALNYDLMRSLARGEPWLLLEHATSAVNWREVNLPKRPGQMRLWAYQALARGSDGVMFFQWRASRAGAEKFHSAMVPHLGRESRGWLETVRLGTELRTLEEIAGSTSTARVALLLDWDNWWALEGADHPSDRMKLPTLVADWYRPLFRANVATDFAQPGDDLTRYALVVAPNLYLLTDAGVRSLATFVADGGVLVVGCFSGVVDENDHVRPDSSSEGLRSLVGVRVDEFWPLLPNDEERVEFDSGKTAPVHDWSEWLELEGAEPIARYVTGPLAGRPAVVRNRVGSGAVYYSSAWLDATGTSAIVERACAEAGVNPVVVVPPNVEACRRRGERASYLFLLNHGDDEVVVELEREGSFELVRASEVGTRLSLGPLEVAVVREPATRPERASQTKVRELSPAHAEAAAEG